MTSAYQQAFRHLFDGSVELYDPWDASHRTSGPQYPGTTMCSAFRTFQGWTALSDMAHDQGVLHRKEDARRWSTFRNRLRLNSRISRARAVRGAHRNSIQHRFAPLGFQSRISTTRRD